MSVSLKKPDKTEKKLPEYTPIHLIDEEDTIKNRPARSSVSNIPTVKPKTRQCTPVHNKDEQETHSDFHQYENERRKQKKWYVLAWFGAVVLVILVFVAAFLLVVNMPFKPVETPAEDITTDMTVVESIFSLVSPIVEWLSESPLVMLMICISFIGLFIHLFRSLMNNRF